jgi:hypothetical protein
MAAGRKKINRQLTKSRAWGSNEQKSKSAVLPGLVPGIHADPLPPGAVEDAVSKEKLRYAAVVTAWMAGT